MRAYQEEHDVCSSFAWRQLAQSWNVDAGYAQTMVIVFGEDVGQCVLGMDSSSAKSVMAGRGTGRIRHLHCPMLRVQKRLDFGDIRTEKRNAHESTKRQTLA